MVCTHCSSRISFLARGDSQFCSSRCRLAAHRALPPRELREVDRWVRWMRDKVPMTVDGRPASSTNASTWSTFDAAAASKVGAGFGFVLNASDRIVCVDIDHCLTGKGRPQPWASDLLDSIPTTYVEVSPSGDGLHVWGFGDVVKGRKSAGVEVYGTGRYITVTGRRWRHAPSTFADLGDWIKTLI